MSFSASDIAQKKEIIIMRIISNRNTSQKKEKEVGL